MIEVLQSAEIMRYLVLTKEDQFLLKNQRSKVIDSSDDNNNDLIPDQKIVDKAGSELYDLEAQYQNINKIFTQGDKRMNESQKTDLRKLLNRYQDKAVNKQQFRILQGVLTQNFGMMEIKRKARQAKKSEINQLKSDVKGLTKKDTGSAKSGNGNFFELPSMSDRVRSFNAQ